MSELVSITIKLLNRAYRIKAAAVDEGIVRNTAQAINDKLAELKKAFPGRDEQDYLAMTLIDFITSSKEEPAVDKKEKEQWLQQLTTIHTLLDE